MILMHKNEGEKLKTGASARHTTIDDNASFPLTRLATNAGQVICCVCCLLSPALCYAENLSDPTRPPPSIFAPVAVGSAQEELVKPSTGLHSVLISKTRRAAIIDGQIVELGEEHGGARLIEVNEGDVVMQRGQSRQVLTLFPGVKITRKVTSGNAAAENESPGKDTQIKQPSSAITAPTGTDKAEPVVQDEKILSGHPKEEK